MKFLGTKLRGDRLWSKSGDRGRWGDGKIFAAWGPQVPLPWKKTLSSKNPIYLVDLAYLPSSGRSLKRSFKWTKDGIKKLLKTVIGAPKIAMKLLNFGTKKAKNSITVIIIVLDIHLFHVKSGIKRT